MASAYQYFLWENAIHEKFGATLVKTSCKVQYGFIKTQRSDLQSIVWLPEKSVLCTEVIQRCQHLGTN